MSAMSDPQSSYCFEFAFSASGNQTVDHDLTLPSVNGNYANALETVITEGDAYVHNVAAGSFDVYCTSATVRGYAKARVRVGDYPA